MLKITLNLDGLLPLFAGLTKDELRKVRKRAVKKAVAVARKESVNKAAEVYAMKKKDLRKRIFVRPNEGTRDNPKARLEFQFKDIGLENFKAKETKRKGVAVRIKRNGSVHRFRHAFMAKGARGPKKLVFIRERAVNTQSKRFVGSMSGKGPHRSARGAELPIMRMITAGLTQVMAPKAPGIVRVAGEAAQKELMRQIALILGTV